MSEIAQQVPDVSEMSEMNGAPRPARRMNPTMLLIVMGLVLLLVFGFGMALLKANLNQLEGGVAPDFTIKTYDGKTFKLSQYRGQVVLVNFWASWCGPCRSEASDLNAIWREYKDRGVVFIGVGHLDNENDAKAFIDEFDIPYMAGPDILTDASTKYRVKGVPETYIIDKQGNLVVTIPGPTTAANLRPILDRLIN
jgi:cytochrome c biogenesis protein CcmG/thiol:disulfide interchange protein DsbE